MYIIKAVNGEDEYLLHNALTDEYILQNCTSDTERNKTGSMAFDITPAHPNYDCIIPMKTEIVVEQDGEFLHSFRALNPTTDIYKTKTWICEGELGFLNDSNQRYGEYHDISVKDFFDMIISKHNEDVNSEKQFTVGIVNVTDSNDSLYRYASYENTWDYINDKLIDRLGGYIRVRHSDGMRYIDYVTDYGNVSTQTIRLGSNLIDLNSEAEASDVITVLIPLGTKLTDADGEETEERLTIADAVVGDTFYGKDYIEDAEAISIYGKIVGTVIYDDVTLADNLYKKGLEYLNKQKLMQTQVELTATDLHLTDKELEAFRLGDSVRVVSTPHGLDSYLKIEKLHIDYNDAANFKMTLGYTKASLTESVNKTNSEVISEIRNIKSETKEELIQVKNRVSEYQSSVEQSMNKIQSQVSEQTSITSTLEKIQEDFSTSITQNSKEIIMNFSSQIQTVRDDVYENTGLIESYIRFRDGLIELGKVGSNFSAQLSNEELAFYEYAQKIAYISGSKLHIVQAEAEKVFTMGNDATGKYDFIAKSNGNLTFKYREV